VNRVGFGIFAGLGFAVLYVLPMLSTDRPDLVLAITGAFVNRFMIGFLIPNTTAPRSSRIRGVFLGTLLSVPDALLADSPLPILVVGMLGGLIIGIILARAERKWIDTVNTSAGGGM
jgi:hypothetical protein